MDQLISRVEALERRAEKRDDVLANFGARLSSLETSRDNEKARHSSTPTWILGTISAAVAVGSLLFNLFLAGLRP